MPAINRASTGTVTASWQDGSRAWMAVRVENDTVDYLGQPSAVEYLASTPLLDAQGVAVPNATLQSTLTALIQAQRSVTVKPATTPLGFTGSLVNLS